MNVDDRVKHRKYGLGTIKKLYDKNDAARVEYDSGHVTVNARKRLTVVAADFDRAPEPPAPTAPSKVTRSRAAGTSHVDYKLLARAKAHLENEHPDADHVVPRLYNQQAYCEVWRNGAAQIYFYEERG